MITRVVKLIFVLLLLASALYAQQQQTYKNAGDCILEDTRTTTGRSLYYQNKISCSYWQLSWDVTGSGAAVNFTLQGAPFNTAGTSAGTFVTFTSTIAQTGTSGMITASGYYPYLGINITSITGTMKFKLQGYVRQTASSGGGAPTGAAGGSLEGTYPNPTLAASGVTARTYGSATLVPVVAVNTEGRVTGVTEASLVIPGRVYTWSATLASGFTYNVPYWEVIYLPNGCTPTRLSIWGPIGQTSHSISSLFIEKSSGAIATADYTPPVFTVWAGSLSSGITNPAKWYENIDTSTYGSLASPTLLRLNFGATSGPALLHFTVQLQCA